MWHDCNFNYQSIHVNHSGGRKRRLKRPETAIKRPFTALILTVFHHNPSFQITGRFSPYFYTFLEWRITATFWHRFSPVFYRLRPFTAPLSSTWELLVNRWYFSIRLVSYIAPAFLLNNEYLSKILNRKCLILINLLK